MSKGQILRALVKKRLTEAAEDIFGIFERTIARYEEELSRSQEENQRKQQLLDSALNQRMELLRGNVHAPSTSPGPSLERDVKQEDEQLPVAVCVKTEEPSLLQQTALGEDIGPEPRLFSGAEGQADAHGADDWGTPFVFPAAPMEPDPDVNHHHQVRIGDRGGGPSPQSEPQTSVRGGPMSGAEAGAESKKHQCPFCTKRFGTKHSLQLHIRVHTGERPYSCSNCKKHFADSSTLRRHERSHTGEKPYICPVCSKAFSQKWNLRSHMSTHTI